MNGNEMFPDPADSEFALLYEYNTERGEFRLSVHHYINGEMLALPRLIVAVWVISTEDGTGITTRFFLEEGDAAGETYVPGRECCLVGIGESIAAAMEQNIAQYPEIGIGHIVIATVMMSIDRYHERLRLELPSRN